MAKKSKKSKKPNKILKEQLVQSFDRLPNAEQIKQGFVESLEQSLDVEQEPEAILTGVGSLNDIDHNALEDLGLHFDEADAMFYEHQKECEKCAQDEHCQEADAIFESQVSWTIYSDGEKIDKGDGTLDIVNDTITVQCNWEVNTYQVIKSPKTEKHGLCSLCYPNQADLDSEGEHTCYALPDDYKIQQH